jgi:hypothetical protein
MKKLPKLKIPKKEPVNTGRRRLNTVKPTENSSNNSYSYSSRRSEESLNVGRKTDRVKEQVARSSSFWLQRFGLLILLIAVCASLFNILTLSSTPIVRSMYYGETPLTTSQKQAYAATASKALKGSILNSNKLTVNTSSISSQLEKQFKNLENVDVAIPLVARDPVVYVEPSQPSIILAESNGVYALDDTGRAVEFSANTNSINPKNLPVLTDESGLKVSLNHQVLSSTDINFVQVVIAELSAKSFHVSSMSLPAAAGELDVSLVGEPYFIKFNLENNDPRSQAGTFLAIVSYLSSQGTAPTHYVDVRIDGRAYYI